MVSVARELKREYSTERGINFPKIIESGYSLVAMTYEQSEVLTIAYLTVLFSDLLNYFNVKSNLNESQLDYFVYDFYENYTKGLADDPSYTIEDVALFCQQAKSGKFGKVYQSLDGSILNEWVQKFDNERYESYQKHLQQLEKIEDSKKDREIQNPPSEETLAKFKEKYNQVVNTLGQPLNDENEQSRRQKERIENRKKMFYGEGLEIKENEVNKIKDKTELPDKEKRLQEFWNLRLQDKQNG